MNIEMCQSFGGLSGSDLMLSCMASNERKRGVNKRAYGIS